jgi:hypothetical protein
MKLEKDLWRELKKFKSSINWTRLENRCLFGTPDILGYNNNGNFFLVELKLTKVNKIRFSPHQIAFFVRHPKNSFVLVAGSPDPELVRLYPGSRILELVDDGLRLEPLASGLAACVALFESLGASKILRRT